jgi:hypothetical protein
MHIRFIPDPAQVRLGEQPSGYTMAFPVAGSVARMQSTMAATLNIDWIVDRAREAAAMLGREMAHRDALRALDARVLDGRPGAALFHPYIHRAGERGPFVEPNARAMFTGLSTQVRFVDLLRAVYEGLAFAARDCYEAIDFVPDEVRIAGGASRSSSLKAILSSILNVPIRESAREEAGAIGSRPSRRSPPATINCSRSTSRRAKPCLQSGAASLSFAITTLPELISVARHLGCRRPNDWPLPAHSIGFGAGSEPKVLPVHRCGGEQAVSGHG